MTMAPDPAVIDRNVRQAGKRLLEIAADAMVLHTDIAAVTGLSDEVVEDSLRRQQDEGYVRFYAEGSGPLRVYSIR
jgi:hypothetical protein